MRRSGVGPEARDREALLEDDFFAFDLAFTLTMFESSFDYQKETDLGDIITEVWKYATD